MSFSAAGTFCPTSKQPPVQSGNEMLKYGTGVASKRAGEAILCQEINLDNNRKPS